MATKKELIKSIKALSEDETIVGDLNSMNKEELEQLLEYLEKLEKHSAKIEEEIIEEEPLGITKEMVDEVIFGEEEKEEKVEESPYLPESEWSVADRRSYARTGRLPLKKK